MRRTLSIAGLSLCVVASMGQNECSGLSEADRQLARQTREASSEGARQVGFPGINNFTEKRLLRQLYELRDQQDLATHTYIIDLQGRLHHLCESIGYGMPFSAQFSNPEVFVDTIGEGGNMVPQPEPNGLWVPDSTSATWVICASPDGEFTPLYVEPAIVVSPFALNAATSLGDE
jgi:hypothetical protein